MELTLCPRRGRCRRVVTMAAAVLVTWLAALLLVPTGLGLQTAVVDESRGSFAEGTVVLTRVVPTTDVVRDDLIAASGGLWRVSATQPGLLRVDGAASVVTGDTPTTHRVVAVLPLLGLPLAGVDSLLRWLLAGAAAAWLVAMAATHRAPRRWRLAA